MSITGAHNTRGLAMLAQLIPGAIFDTPFEVGCEVITQPTALKGLDSRFDAYDSERVVCSFCVVMVERVAS